MKLHRTFALIGAVALLALLISASIMFGLSREGSDGAGFIGIAFLGAYVILAAIFVLFALPFLCLATWLFRPLVFPDKSQLLAPSKRRVFIAFTWNIIAGGLAGSLPYALHNINGLKPLYAELNEQGGLYLSAIGGYTVGLIGSSIILSLLSVFRLKRRSNYSLGILLYGIFSLTAGIVIMGILFKLNSETLKQPSFTVYTLNDVSAKQYPVRYKSLDGEWPTRVEVWLRSPSSNDGELYQTETSATDAFNPKTNSCVPPPFTDKAFYTDFACTYVTTSDKGIRIYKDTNGHNSFFVINGTFLMLDRSTPADANFVDNLVPGELAGTSIKPSHEVAPLKFSLYVPVGTDYKETSDAHKKSIVIPYAYKNSSGTFELRQKYTSQKKPTCVTSPYHSDKRGSLCKEYFITPKNREVYQYDSLYFTIIGNTEITITNLPYSDTNVGGQKAVMNKMEFMNLIDSLQEHN